MNTVPCHLELSSVCNLKCGFCPTGQGKVKRVPYMTLKQVKKVVKLNPEIGTYGLNNWGEPLLNPQLILILKFLHEKGKGFFFATNATLLTETMSHNILLNHPQFVIFSVDAVDKLYEKLRGFPYEQLKQNIHCFLNLRTLISPETKTLIVCAVNCENEGNISELVSQWERFVDTVTFQPMLTWKRRDKPKNFCNQATSNHHLILTDGCVTPCCVDWNGLMVLGDGFKTPLREMVKPNDLLKSELCMNCTEYTLKVKPEYARFGK